MHLGHPFCKASHHKENAFLRRQSPRTWDCSYGEAAKLLLQEQPRKQRHLPSTKEELTRHCRLGSGAAYCWDLGAPSVALWDSSPPGGRGEASVEKQERNEHGHRAEQRAGAQHSLRLGLIQTCCAPLLAAAGGVCAAPWSRAGHHAVVVGVGRVERLLCRATAWVGVRWCCARGSLWPGAPKSAVLAVTPQGGGR